MAKREKAMAITFGLVYGGGASRSMVNTIAECEKANKIEGQTQFRKKAVVLLSGGLDSTTLLYYLDSLGWEVWPLSINYGQRHEKEIEHAQKVAEALGAGIYSRGKVYILPSGLMGGSSLTTDSIKVPEGHYADESMKATVVPNRNMVLLSLAGAYAVSIGASVIGYAAHAGDHPIYPDCRPEFVDSFNKTLQLATGNQVSLLAPFINKTKAQIVEIGTSLSVPYKLTWSCYQGGIIHCGKCGTCVERIEAFKLAGVKDPTVYSS